MDTDHLERVLAEYPNIRIIHGDILKLSPSVLMDNQKYIVVANIPYYITSLLIRHLLEAEIKPQKIVLTIQREVAERICAKPGDLSLLALSVQVFGKSNIMHLIPSKAFYPQPKVDSAVVLVELYPGPLIPQEQLDTFFMLAKAGFSQKRKTIRNSISTGMAINPKIAEEIIANANIDPVRRAETLSIEDWRVLTNTYLNHIEYAKNV
jgi:16S rRNA (adenine1518-N6/adenine1519-N6)-dimethyltransferase